MSQLRVAAVRYFNARPLIDGLQTHPDICLQRHVPSRLIDLLQGGCADVALVPVIDLLRSDRRLPIACPYGIGCRDQSVTVRIRSPVSIDRIDSLIADRESHTSIALATILINKFAHRPPTIQPQAVEDPSRPFNRPTLLIGDKVMHAGPAQYDYDLGRVWNTIIDLPFVFAVWAAVDQPAARRFSQIATPQIQANLARLDALAQTFGPQHGFTVEQARHYLTAVMHYQLDDQMWAGLDRFAREAAALNLCPDRRLDLEPFDLCARSQPK